MIRRYFIAGLLIWVPLWITLLVISFLSGLMDKSLHLLPENLQPDNLLGMHIPGLGLVFTLLLVFLTGIFAANFFGNKLLALGEALLKRIPVVRSIYSGSKQVVQTIFSSEGESFKKVLLVRFPHQDIWSVAFQTGSGIAEVQDKLGGEWVTVFVPTTPNPTAGFLMLAAKQDTMELKMSVDDAFKFIISLGVVLPQFQPKFNKDAQ